MNGSITFKAIMPFSTALILSMIFMSCGGSMEAKNTKYSEFSEVSDADWAKLSSKSYFFGHQSVGNNILQGIEDITATHPSIKLKVVATDNKNEISKGVLAHYRVGANLNPVGKIEDFAILMNNGIGNKADYAFVKLCYLDINKNTNVENVFESYVRIISELKKKYPKTTFIHFTSPLTVSKISWKTKIKQSLGVGELWELNDNIRRNKFNSLLREKFQNREPFFDIAAFESILPDGKQYRFEEKGEKYQYLAPEYTSDGGHLNKYGQKRIAEQLLLMLLQLS